MKCPRTHIVVMCALADHTRNTATLDFKGHPEFGKFFQEKVFAPGSRRPWPEFVRECTGNPLGIAAYAAKIR